MLRTTIEVHPLYSEVPRFRSLRTLPKPISGGKRKKRNVHRMKILMAYGSMYKPIIMGQKSGSCVSDYFGLTSLVNQGQFRRKRSTSIVSSVFSIGGERGGSGGSAAAMTLVVLLAFFLSFSCFSLCSDILPPRRHYAGT